MKPRTVKEDWERLCNWHFGDEELPPYQKEVMEWCFYHGVSSLLGKMHIMGREQLPQEEVGAVFQSVMEELTEFFKNDANKVKDKEGPKH